MALDSHDQTYFDAWRKRKASFGEDRLDVGPFTIMHAWERPLMRELARVLAEEHGSVLEIGYGMGISAGFIQEFGVDSHTIIEPHPEIFRAAQAWRESCDGDITLVEGLWQDHVEELGRFDGILFDPSHAPARQEIDREKFFEFAARRLLNPGGRLLFWHKGDTLSEMHQQMLLKHFREVRVSLVDCGPPPDSHKTFPRKLVVPVAIL